MVKPRTRRFRNRIGVKNSWKKAFVSLKDGFEIDFMGGD
jgi:ribosomal protein L23